jgi:hypothetical protein
MKVHNLLVTGSHTSSGEDIRLISSSVAAINNAQNGRLNSIESITGSLVSKTGSFATTGSNVFVGNQTISGSIIPAVNGLYDLGSSTHEFRHLYLSSASLYIDGTKVLGSTTQELQITTDTGQSFKILEAGSDTITLQSADGNITLATSGGGDVILDPTTGIIALKGSTQVYAGNRILSSDGNAIHFGNGVIISGSLLATGTNIISGSQQISDFGYTTTSSVNTISSSINTRINSITNIQATTGSNNFVGTQTITGSLYISSDLVVQGSSSLQNITASAVNIGANIVNLNTANPAIRFAGMSIFDSGSIGGSGSFLYDSQQDEFIFIHRGDGVNITSSVVLMGAQTYNSVGSEIYPTTNRLLKGTGNEHVGDSIVSETNGGIGISGSLSVTGSFVATGTSLWSGSAQLPSGIVSSSAQTIANLPSGVVSGSAQTIANLPSGTVSGSSQVSFTGTTGYSTYINQAVLTTSSPTFAGLTNNGTYSQSTTSTQPVMIYGDSGDTNGLFRIQMDSISDSFGTGARTFLGDGGIDIFLGTSNSSYTPANTYIALNHGGEISMGAGSATKHLILSTSGYLGVNVNPTQRLHLYDASPSSGILAKLESGAVTGWLQLTSTGTSWQIGATATGLQFWSDNETSTKLTVLTGGSILMNQDVAIRAGASQNWILGQDSGTNVIHMGSTGVANDIRFDSSTGSGIVMIKSNGNLGVGFTTVTNKLQVAGEITTHAGTNTQFYAYMNYLGTTYNLGPGETSDNIDFKIVGGATFATGGNFRWFTQAGGTTPTERFRLTPTGPAYFTNKLTVGGTGNYSSATLSVEGPVRANRSIYNWYQSGTNSWDGYQYLHLKTTLWGGGGGSNSQPTMSMFSAKLYSYSSAYIREGNLAFHNWSGSIYNQVTTGTIWYGAYVSSDGYVTLILALGGGSYHGVHIDWHQSFGYGFQDRYVSSTAYTNTASSLY